MENDEPRELTTEKRWAIIAYINLHLKGGKDQTMKQIAAYFRRDEKTLRTLYKEYLDQMEEGEQFPDLSPNKEGNVGRPSELTPEIEERLREIRNEHDGYLTLKFFSLEYQENYGETIAPSTIRRYLHEMGLHQARSHLKPSLTTSQKLKRLEYIVCRIGNGKHFSLEIHRIHIDEKWFYVITLDRP